MCTTACCPTLLQSEKLNCHVFLSLFPIEGFSCNVDKKSAHFGAKNQFGSMSGRRHTYRMQILQEKVERQILSCTLRIVDIASGNLICSNVFVNHDIRMPQAVHTVYETYVGLCTLVHKEIYIYTRTQERKHVITRVHTKTHTHVHTYIQTHSQTYIYAQAHTHTRTNTYKQRTLTHTTHARMHVY